MDQILIIPPNKVSTPHRHRVTKRCSTQPTRPTIRHDFRSVIGLGYHLPANLDTPFQEPSHWHGLPREPPASDCSTFCSGQALCCSIKRQSETKTKNNQNKKYPIRCRALNGGPPNCPPVAQQRRERGKTNNIMCKNVKICVENALKLYC